MEKEEEELRKEAAMASTPCLEPNFNPKGVTKEQLSKFRELHKRRLQLKSKSKFKMKFKDDPNKSQGTNQSSQKSGAKASRFDEKETSLWNSEAFDIRNEYLIDNDVSVLSTPKKQKLHWGLDTKERWERKSNM